MILPIHTKASSDSLQLPVLIWKLIVREPFSEESFVNQDESFQQTCHPSPRGSRHVSGQYDAHGESIQSEFNPNLGIEIQEIPKGSLMNSPKKKILSL